MNCKHFTYFFLSTLCALSLEANPSDHTVTAGHASCTSSAQKLEVHAHDKTIISWKDFSIGQNETTRFNLPSKDAVILNRVESNNISKIEGLLSSNGIVYLINPNGILITSFGKIDTAGFLASTLNITDQDFLNGGDLLFTGSGSITNLGTIRCSSGDVVLMASTIKNEGIINAGTIALGAGQEILMTLKGDERLTVRLAAPSDSKEEVGIHQTGTLESVKTELKADGNLYAYAIKNEGTINAIATVHLDGRIYLVAEKGHVTSSGTLKAPGGEVRVLGNITSLTDNASIDVSHEDGGGTILVGGDYQGKNPDILNALVTYAGPDVVLSASSLQSGSGGKVIAWADGETGFYGKVYARGGPLGGDGGFTEISGKNNLDFLGVVDLTAPQGKTGMLLLDPTNVTFSTAVDSGFTVIPPTCVSGYVLSGAPATANVNIPNLLTNLATCSVTISTAVATGSVTLSAGSPLTWTGITTNSLTVNATTTLAFNAALTNNTTGGSMTWTGTTVSIAAAIANTSTSGNITISGTGAVSQTAAGTITNTSTSGAINISGSAVTLTSGAIQNGPLTGATINTPTIALSGTAAGSFGAGAVAMTSNTAAGGGITLSGFTTIGLNGPITNGPTSGGPSGAGTISITGSGTLTQAAAAPIINNTATGTVSLTTTGAAASITANGNLTNNASSPGGVAYSAGLSITFGAGAGYTQTGSAGGTFAAGQAANGAFSTSATSTISTSGTGTLSIMSTNATVTTAVNIAGPLNLGSTGMFSATATAKPPVSPTAGGNVVISGAINSTVSAPFNVSAPGPSGAITLSGSTVSFNPGSAVSLISTGNTTLSSPSMTFGASSGSLTVTAGTVSPLALGAIAINGTLNYSSPGACQFISTGALSSSAAGAMTFNSGCGDITFKSTASTVAFSAAPLIIFNSGAGNCAVTTLVGAMTIGQFDFESGSSKAATFTSAAAMTLNGNFTYGNSSNPCTMTSVGNLTYQGGTMTFNTSSLTMTSSGAGIITAATGPIVFNSGAGSLTMTAPGSISMSGALTSNSTSPVTIQSTAGGIGISALTFNDGSLTITAPGGINLVGNIIYNGSGAFNVTSTNSAIATTGTLTVGAAAGPVTWSALASVTTNNTITYNGFNPFSLISTTTGDVRVHGVTTITTPAPLFLTSSFAPNGQGMFITNSITNTSTGPIIVSGYFLNLGAVAVGGSIPVVVGSAGGDLTLDIISLQITAGIAPGAFSQVGYNQGTVNSNINFVNCNQVWLYPGTADNCYAVVGHGSPSNTGVLTGNINFTSTGPGNIDMGDIAQIFTGSRGSNCFSQIGHIQSQTAPTTAVGDINIATNGYVAVVGCNNTNTYSIIGHGGGLANGFSNSYTGDVIIQAAGDVRLKTMNTPAAVNSFAAIGPVSLVSGGTTEISGGMMANTVSINAGGTLSLQSEANNECIVGAYVKGSGGGTGTINPLNINVTAGGLVMTGISPPGTSVNGTLIGALAYTGAVPFVPAGTSSSTLTVNISGDLQMQTSAGGTNTNTFSVIQNGLGGPVLPTIVTVGGSTSMSGGNNLCSITGTGAVTLSGTGPVTLLSTQTPGFLEGKASVIGNGPTTVAGSVMSLTGCINGPQALIQTPTDNLTVSSQSMTLANNAKILLSGTGDLTVTALTGDLVMDSLASIQNSGSGSTSMTVGGVAGLLAGEGNVTIMNNTGPLTLTVSDNLNLMTNTNGSAFITSNGPITITAQNVSLFGLGAGQQSHIQGTAGDMLIIAQNNVTLSDNALVSNLGPGALILVVDEQAPVFPQIGSGRFILRPNAMVSSAGGLLRIFTAAPNNILLGNLGFGELNGNFVTAGFSCPFDRPVPSNENQYSTYFLTYTGLLGDPYTIFYKQPPELPVNLSALLQRDLAKLIWSSSEMFWFMRDYPRYEFEKSEFLVCSYTNKRKSRTSLKHRYPVIHQNWTLYPVEFKRHKDCDM